MSEETSTAQATTTPATNEAVSKDEKLWATFCHLSPLLQLVIPIPAVSVIAPLVLWLIKKDAMPLVNDQGREAVNFQISLFIYSIVAAILMFILIGFVLMGALLVFAVITMIMAVVKVNDGVKYRYPFCIRLIK